MSLESSTFVLFSLLLLLRAILSQFVDAIKFRKRTSLVFYINFITIFSRNSYCVSLLVAAEMRETKTRRSQTLDNFRFKPQLLSTFIVARQYIQKYLTFFFFCLQLSVPDPVEMTRSSFLCVDR